MFPRQILTKLSFHELTQVSKLIHKFFPLVHSDRILQLILQVDSIDRALELLMIHKECPNTMDAIVYDYLRGKDER